MLRVNLRSPGIWPRMPLLLAALWLAAPPVLAAEFPLAISMAPRGWVQLGWETPGPEGARFEVYRRQGAGPETALDATNLYPQKVGEGESRRFSVLFWDKSARNGTSYTYRVVMLGPGGARLGGSPVKTFVPHDLHPPARVEGLTARADEGKVSLTWKPLGDPEVIAYRLYRRAVPLPRPADAGPAGKGGLLAELGPGVSNHADADVRRGTLYYYEVAAVDAADGEGELSVPALATLPDTDPPQPPGGLEASAAADGTVQLRWVGSPSPDATLYVVYRGVAEEGERVPVLRVAARGAATHEAEDRLPAGSPYGFVYAVTAVDGGGNESAPTPGAKLRLPDRTPPGAPILTEAAVEPGGIRLAWAPPGDEDVVGYHIYRRDGAKKEAPVRLTSEPVSATEYEDRTVGGGVVYGYEIRAVDRDGNEGRASEARSQRAFARARAEVPGGVAVREESGTVRLSWAGVESPDLRGYLVDRGPSREGPFEQVSGLVTGTSFSDRDAVERAAMWYCVRAFYRGGRVSEPSEAVEWRPAAAPDGKEAR